MLGAMPRRSAGWIWAGRVVAAVIVAGLAVYLVSVGLERADKIASVLGALAAVTALVLPYLVRPRRIEPAEPPPGAVDLRGARGVQLNQGGTNSQVNHFRDES